MKRTIVFISILVILLAGCSPGGPSNSQAKEVIFGVYFKDASILEKRHCELTPEMEEEGKTSVWLVRYKFKDSGTEGVMLLSREDSEDYPWIPYMLMAGVNEDTLQRRCP